MKLWITSRCFLITVSLTLVFPGMSNALNIDWARQIGASGVDLATGIATGSMGDTYLAGTMAVIVPDAPPSGNAFLAKYDVAGNQQWLRQLDSSSWDEANAVITDNLGNVYIAGSTNGKLGNTEIATGDSFVSKYDVDGNLLWTSQFGSNLSPYASQTSTSIAMDGLGSLYVTGMTTGDAAANHIDAFVTRLDNSGSVVWTRQFGSNRDERGTAIAADALGNIFVTGVNHGTFFGDPDRFTYSSDAFVAKLDSTGNIVWSRSLGTAGWDFGFAASADGVGNVYIAGATDGKLGEHYGGGFHDAFLAKYDGNGEVLWIQQLGGEAADEAYGMTFDDNGGVYITGNTDNLTPRPSNRIGNSFVAKYDVQGNLLWAEELGEPGARAISAGQAGRLFVAGRTLESLDGPNAGMEDAFLARISYVPEPCVAHLIVIAAALVCTRHRGEFRK